MATLKRSYFDVRQSSRNFTLTVLPAGFLTDITYTAVRGVDEEDGAVQRVLTKNRVKSVMEFVLNGGDFPGCIVLNWQEKLAKKNKSLIVKSKKDLAQIIDGQHRIEGIREAIKVDDSFRKLSIPVVIYETLDTEECADIFLAINTQQKTVSRSLVYDLYGVSSELTADPAIVRARDIAESINEIEDSPYLDSIRFPGHKRGIVLSSVVSAIKELVAENGSFEQVGVNSLEHQITVLLNFFRALKIIYGKEWESRKNAFQYAGGFTAACRFLQLKMIPYCISQASFETKIIKHAIALEKEGLIYQEEVKGQSGSEAVKIIQKRLLDAFSPKKVAPKIKF